MKIKVMLSQPFKDMVGKGEFVLNLRKCTVKYLIAHLAHKYPKFGSEIYNKDGSITDYVSIMVNDAPIDILKGVDTVLSDNDNVLIFVPIGGG
jgi:MoaD family protein